MNAPSERLRLALLSQLAHRRELLTAGARHVGWKLGTGTGDSVDGSIGVGHITSATLLDPGDAYRAAGRAIDLRADVELAVELGQDIDPEAREDEAHEAITAYATALELVDISSLVEDPAMAIATNDFHRAIAFGPFRPVPTGGLLAATGSVNGTVRDSGETHPGLAERLIQAARVLEAVGEGLRNGDRVSTGLIVQLAIRPGDTVEAEIDSLGPVRLTIAE